MDDGLLLAIEAIDNFGAMRSIPPKDVSQSVIGAVKDLDEREDIEPCIRTLLFDTNATPHGPAEIADILTHKVTIGGKPVVAAFIIKGKSFRTVRPVDVSHQIYRLEKIEGLGLGVFVAPGKLLDAAKEEFISTALRLDIRYSIADAMDTARLLIAGGFLCPKDGSRIRGGRCACGYTPAVASLNVLQVESLRELAVARQSRERAGLVVLPTGTGKTRIAARDAMAADAKCVLYVAHTHEILDVAQGEFEAVFGTRNVIRHSDGSRLAESARVHIATVQLLRRRLADIAPRSYDYLVVDEFHHAAAGTYRQLIDTVTPQFLLGLTATPFRGDRQDIAQLCDNNVLVNYELRTAIECGILAPYHYFGCFDDIDYSKIPLAGSTYSIRDLERALIIPDRDAAIIKKWRELAPDRPTLAFCCSHRHARRVAESFCAAGIPTSSYLSDTDATTRQSLVQKLRKGRLKVLAVVDVLNEGADLPFVECLLFLRPTESRRVFFQQLGRGLRRHVGKSHCIVIDFIGNFKNAYMIVEYQALSPFAFDDTPLPSGRSRTAKDILNLPLGCSVHFDTRVVDVFQRQLNDPRHATRHNIGRILIYQYRRLAHRLGRVPSRRDVNQNLLLDDRLFLLVFGTWKNVQRLLEE